MMDVTGPQRTTFASSKMLGFGWGNPIIARPAREARPLSAGPLTASSVVLSRMRSAIPSSKWDSLHATSACFHSAGHAAVASTIGPRPRVYAAGAVRPQSAGSCVPRPATSPQCAAHWLIHITSVCSLWQNPCAWSRGNGWTCADACVQTAAQSSSGCVGRLAL